MGQAEGRGGRTGQGGEGRVVRSEAAELTSTDAPRIVNIYSFIRAIEPRIPAITSDVLRDTTAKQIQWVKTHALPATFALQYGALIDPRYQDLLRGEFDESCEIGAWWEIVQRVVDHPADGLPVLLAACLHRPPQIRREPDGAAEHRQPALIANLALAVFCVHLGTPRIQKNTA